MARNTQRNHAWAEQPPCRPEFELAGLSSVSTWRSSCQQVVTLPHWKTNRADKKHPDRLTETKTRQTLLVSGYYGELMIAKQSYEVTPLVCGTVFHRASLLPPLSPSSAVVLNHISSYFLTPLSVFSEFLSYAQCPRSDSSFWTL